VEVLRMLDSRSLIKIAKMRLLRHLLSKQYGSSDKETKVIVRYNIDGDTGEVEFTVSDANYMEEAPAAFLAEANIDEQELSKEVREIIEKVFRHQAWFEITPLGESPKTLEEPTEGREIKWKSTEVKTERGTYKAHEGTVVVDGKEYRVEKAPNLQLSMDDIKQLINARWFKLDVNAYEAEPYPGSFDAADDAWKERRWEWGEGR
jgi:hypothetical protein